MNNLLYNKKTIIRYAMAFVALMVGMKFTSGGAFVVMIPIAIAFLAGRNAEKLLFVVLVSTLTLIGNGFFMPKGLVYAISQRSLMMLLGGLMIVQIFGRKNSPLLTPLLGIAPYIAFMFCTSIEGWSPLISYLKLTMFTFIFIGIYASANRAIVSQMDIRKFRSMLLAVSCVVIFGSILVIPLGGIGYMGAEAVLKDPNLKSLFRGMLNHSQTMGVVAGALGCLILADWLFSVQRMDKLYALLSICVPILLVKSACRTAMGAYLAGCMVLLFLFMKSRNVKVSWHSKVTQLSVAMLVVLALAVVATPYGRDKVARFVLKYHTEGKGKVSLTTEDILSSRQGKIDTCLRNWHASPTIGNGFQVSEEMKGFSANSLKQVLSAPVEKSTWIFAILEEGGVIGEILFVGFILLCSILFWRRKAYIGFVCFWSMIICNLGEFEVFSMSGGGGTSWVLVFLGVVLDSCRVKEASQPRRGLPPMGFVAQQPRPMEAIDMWERPEPGNYGFRQRR